MTTATTDPADPRMWIEMGRGERHANLLAAAWRDFPDPPFGAPAAERMEQSRKRVAALKSINEEQAAIGERARQVSNFRCVDARVSAGQADDHDIKILDARDRHGYDWDRAYKYADGWYAAHAGWSYRRPSGDNYGPPAASLVAAFDHGFADGGGHMDDVFDAARRANLAALRGHNRPARPSPALSARPLPSSWTKPTDTPRPSPWSRRLLVIEETTAQRADGPLPALHLFDNEFFRALRACPGYEGAAVAILTTRYGIIAGEEVVEPYDPLPAGDATHAIAQDETQRQRLAAILAGRDFDDVLLAATEPYVAIADAHAAVLPLCRTMERTRNSLIQRRDHFRTWLARGVVAGQTVAAGHIRWGKMHAGAKGSLGEFTARYAGPASPRGHAIVVEVDGGFPATGYFDAKGRPLDPNVHVSNKANLRAEIARTLRTFAASTRLRPVAAGRDAR